METSKEILKSDLRIERTVDINYSLLLMSLFFFLIFFYNFFLKDREAFAALVREVASPDVGRMGIEILSFTIKDIEDHVDYLDSLGKTQTAKVKRDADIGVAESNRDAGIRVCILQMKIQPTRHKDC